MAAAGAAGSYTFGLLPGACLLPGVEGKSSVIIIRVQKC